MIDINIKDGIGTGTKAEVRSVDNALKVATVDYNTWNSQAAFFINPIYGIDMNRNWSNEGAGNSNELISNGGDTSAWSGSVIAGADWDLTATNNPDKGSQNIEQTDGDVGDTAQWARGSDVTMTTQTGFSGRIWITSTGHPNAELLFYAWDTGTGTIVGTSVDIYDYVNTSVTLVYQTFSIPLADMNLISATFDSVRIEIAVKSNSIFDMDEIYLTDPTGSSAIGTTTFTLAPDEGRQMAVDSLLINMADTYAGTVVGGTMPSITYDGFLSLPTLSSGMNFQLYDTDRITFTAQIVNMIELFQFGSPRFTGMGSDGTRTWHGVEVSFSAPIILNAPEKDRMTWTLSDDFSDFLFFRVSAGVRDRQLSLVSYS